MRKRLAVLAAVGQLCISAPVLAQPAAYPAVTVVRGFGAQIYLVATPAPVPGAPQVDTCGMTFSQPSPSPSPTGAAKTGPMLAAESSAPELAAHTMWLGNSAADGHCNAAYLAASTKGFEIDFAVYPFKAQPNAQLTLIDNTPFYNEPYVDMSICRDGEQKCTLRYEINLLGHLYAEQHERRTPSVPAKVTQLKAKGCPPPAPRTEMNAPTPPPQCGDDVFAASVVVPWQYLDLPTDSQAHNVKVSLQYVGGQQEQLAAQVKTVSIAVNPAFSGSAPDPLLTPGVDDHRYGAMSAYYRNASPGTTPPPSQDAPVQSGTPIPVKLFKSAQAPAPLARWPIPNGDISAPLTQDVNIAGTFSQNGAFVQAVQNAVQGVVAAKALATPNPLPSICPTCATFQAINASTFNTLKGSAAGLLLPSTSLGSDDSPFSFATLGDLIAGGTAVVSDGPTTVGFLRSQLSNSSPQAFTDTAVGLTNQQGASSVSFVGVSVERTPSPVPSVPPHTATPAPTKITIPYLTTFALAAQGSNVATDDVAHTSTTVNWFGRAAYDATDRALNAFGAGQLQYSAPTGRGNLFTGTALAGYRQIDQGYNELDGVQTSLPGVSGALATIDLALKHGAATRAQRPSPSPSATPVPPAPFSGSPNAFLDLKLTANAYYSPTNQNRTLGAAASWAVSSQFSLTGNASWSTQTAALVAATSLSSQLGDSPLQTAINQLPASQRTTAFGGKDYVLGASYSYPFTADKAQYAKIGAGYDFDHIAPSCMSTTLTLHEGTKLVPQSGIFCKIDAPQDLPLVNGSLVVGPVVLAGYYAPTFYQGQASSTDRVYSAILSYKITPCDSVTASSSNDSATLGSTSNSQIKESVQAELDHSTRVKWLQRDRFMATLFAGYQNTFGYTTTLYQTLPGSASQRIIPLPYVTHAYQEYVGVRVGNRSTGTALAPACFTS